MYSLISFGSCIQLFNHHEKQDTEHFHKLKRLPRPLCSQSPPSPRPQATPSASVTLVLWGSHHRPLHSPLPAPWVLLPTHPACPCPEEAPRSPQTRPGDSRVPLTGPTDFPSMPEALPQGSLPLPGQLFRIKITWRRGRIYSIQQIFIEHQYML